MKRVLGIMIILLVSGFSILFAAEVLITEENLGQLKGVWSGEITDIRLLGPRSSTLEINNDTIPLKGLFIHHPVGGMVGTTKMDFDSGTIEKGKLVISWGGGRPGRVKLSLDISEGKLSLTGEYVAASSSGASGAGKLYYKKEK